MKCAPCDSFGPEPLTPTDSNHTDQGEGERGRRVNVRDAENENQPVRKRGRRVSP